MKKNGNIIAILTMIFLFGMISFVTNLAAPTGVIWKNQPGIDGSNTLGMMGNMMNFLAYLFMGIPAGKFLLKHGYKVTNLLAVAVGFFGVLIQYLSGAIHTDMLIGGISVNFYIYLLGALVAGFSVCLLNTAVNPMLNILGGGGNRGNQLVQIGGTFNSLMATLTPMLVLLLVGEVTKETRISDVDTVLFIAMGVFALTFISLLFIPISNPEKKDSGAAIESPMKYPHFIFGVIAIFLYVGVEVGIPGTLTFYLSDTGSSAGLNPDTAVKTAGFVAGTYWFLMLIGRFLSSLISNKVSSRVQLTFTASLAIILVLCAMFISPEVKTSMPVFTGSGFAMTVVPLSALLLVCCGFCTSVMWGTIFNLSVEGLGNATEKASGIFMMMVVGGGVLPLIQNKIADVTGNYLASYWVIFVAVAYILWFALMGSKVKRTTNNK